MDESFGGDKKVGSSILTRIERQCIAWLVPRVPAGIESYHLTLASIPISIGIILCHYAAKLDIQWLWMVNVLIVLQWLTDSLDGAIGRARHEGLIRWGYYMDHFLDYFFLCSILIGYSLLLPDHFKLLLFFVLAVFGAYMVNSFLAFAATNEFQITHLGIGPTEIRIVFILINALLIIFGKTYLAPALPYVLIFSFFGLVFIVYRTQDHLWKKDMLVKNGAGTVSSNVLYYESPYYLLGGFSAHAVEYKGRLYPTAEHAYQAAKFDDQNIQESIRLARSPVEAKNLAHRHRSDMKKNWDTCKVAVMEDIYRSKMRQHEDVRQALLQSGNAFLGENSPTDLFWGCGPSLEGENWLGKIWMKLRDEAKR